VSLREAVLNVLFRLPDGLSRRALFLCFNRQIPNFRKPTTFNEKVNWRILNDRRQLLEFSCDKLAMKEYVRAIDIPTVRIPRTIWVGDSVRGLENSDLPERWVLKPNNRSGLVYFGSGRPNVASLVTITRAWSRSVQADDMHEWAYSKARSALLVEEFLGKNGSPPADYKFYVFSGIVAAVQVDVGRHSLHQRRYYLPDWSPLEVSGGNHPLAPIEAPPVNLADMISVAGEIGRPFDFMRVDLYSVEGATVFGEVTPYSGSGLDRFIPRSFDFELGRRWQLPHFKPEVNSTR
jgi:hypothetical protein